MAEPVTIARPYAAAIYRLAKVKGALAHWSEMLALIKAIAEDAQMCALDDDPRVTRAQVEKVFLDVAGDRLDAAGVNLVRLLLENRRLCLVPEIARLFEEMRAQDEGVAEAQIIAATALTDDQIKMIVARLESRFKQKIVAKVDVDPEIIGGVKVIVGDTVIDASVRGRLQEMAYTLKG
ncbi:MAG: F0F1 ATP synthase subunit delta [Methylophilaceae bacterium]|nr:F0F1 ATP synthase subunit delta [Methylophilaceae bacterium]